MVKLLATLVMGLLMLSGQTDVPPTLPSDNARLTSFYYSYSGMMLPLVEGIDAEMTQDGWKATFLLGPLDDVEGIHLFDNDVETLEKLVSDYELLSWAGFDETNSNVLDGESFSFSVSFSDGTSISASGSNSFPKGYSDAQYAILSAIEEMLTAHDIKYTFD